VKLNTGMGTTLYCEGLLDEHPKNHGDLRPDEEEEFMGQLSEVL